MKIPYTFCSIGTCGGSLREWIQLHLEETPNKPFQISYNGASRLIDPIIANGVTYFFEIYRNHTRKISVCIPRKDLEKTNIIKVDESDWEQEFPH